MSSSSKPQMAAPNPQGGTPSVSPDVKQEDQDSAVTTAEGKKRRVATTGEEEQRDNITRTAIDLYKTDNMHDIEQSTGDGPSGTGGTGDASGVKTEGTPAQPPLQLGSDSYFDPDAPPVPDAAADAALPLSGLHVTTVAKREGAMRTPTYVNVYSINQRQWHTFGPFEGEANPEELSDLANPKSRRISKQVDNVKKDKVKPEMFVDIIDVVFKYDYATEFPIEAAELLNPRKVKKTDKYPTARKRREYMKDHGGQRLPVYPETLCRVKWRDSKVLTWELASELKALLSKRMIEIEFKIYRVALKRAQDIEPYITQNRVETKVETSQEQTPVLARQATSTQSQTPIPSIEGTGQDNAKTNVVAAVAGTPTLLPPETAVVEQGAGAGAGAGTGLITPPPSKSPEPAQPSPFNAAEFTTFFEEFCKKKKIDPNLKTNKAAALGQFQALLDMGLL